MRHRSDTDRSRCFSSKLGHFDHPTTDVAVTVTGTPSNVVAVIHGGAPTELIEIRGDMDVARRFMTLFPLPEKVEPS